MQEMVLEATGHSTWHGTWKEGRGTISTAGDTLKKVKFSFASRFEGAKGGQPGGVISCRPRGMFQPGAREYFGMIGLEAETVDTSVAVVMGKDEEDHPAIVAFSVDVVAKVPGIDLEQFQKCAERARTRCSMAKVQRCEIQMKATSA